ncbi:gamma-aminobutyric acid type B receptor subunit 2 [Cydia strobilella]|uniref:gamma-aminobutyric acid type B receptor subunit 2 n=1 Tax=Cydia strobilella TaxID=1100964 RepID=UPI00300457B5
MQRPPRGFSHFHCSSLYEPTLTISSLPPLLLILIVFPLTHTQMTNNSTLPERYFQNEEIHKENNYTLKKDNESNITFKHKNITTAVSKEYQILLDRFRRKKIKNMTSEEIFYDIGNLTDNLDDISTNNTFNVSPHINYLHYHQKHSFKLQNIDLLNANDADETSAIEKLRMDDETRTKIFHDYYSTVNKVNAINEEHNTNESITIDVLDYNETIDILFNETEIPQTVTDPKIRRRFSNHSLVFPDNLSSPRVPTIMQTPRPGFVEEISKSSSNRIVSILGLFELSVGVAPRAEGASELAAAQLAVQHVNRRGLLPGYKLHLFTNDTKCDPGVGVDRFFHALYTERDFRMVMLLGSACSEVTESIAKIVPYWNIVQVSFGSTSPALSDRSEFPLFCRTVAPDSSHNPARIAFIRQFGWDTVTAFSQNEEVYSLAVNELVTQLEAANITCAASITFAESDFKEQLKQLKELDTRIIIGSFSQEMIPKIFCEAFKLGMWGAEYAWVVAGAPPRLRATPPCARAQLATALEGLVSVTAHRGIVGDAVSYSGLVSNCENTADESPHVEGARCSGRHAPVIYTGHVLNHCRNVTRSKKVKVTTLATRGGMSIAHLPKRQHRWFDLNEFILMNLFLLQTNEMFHREMAAAGVAVSPYAPQTYDAVWAIALALSKAEQLWQSLDMTQYNGTLLKGGANMALSHFDYNRKDMAEEFLNQLANLSFLGVSGPVSFNGADRIGTSAFYQIQGRKRTVALYTQGRAMACAECARAAWGGGVPAARRVLVLRVESVWAPARLAVAALATAGVALSTAFLAFNLHYSKRRSIKLSSPRLNNMTLIGCVLVYTAVALLAVDNSNLPPYVSFSAMCIGRVYILSAGFSLAFGSMFAKTYRVHRIFVSNRSGVCKTKLLQDTPLISLVCALLLLDGLLVTLWAALDPMQRQLKNLTQEISADDRSVVYQPQIEVCKSQNTAGWLCALYAYKGLLLLVGVYMAWETRNVKISALNDSKYIGISVYSVVITSTSVVVIGTIISERATLAFITITSLILITTTSTLCLLFLPKIVAIRSSKTEDDPVIESLGLRLECKTRRFVTDETQELHFRIEIQNKVYKREVAALDKEIGRLERLLAEPIESATSSNASIALHKRTELNTVEEEDRCRSDPGKRTPSITGGLPMLLLSVLPPVIPRASWPSAEHCRGRNSVSFSSQPKLNYRKSQPAIDLYSLCLNKREEHHGFLSRIRSFFGGSSRPTSRKASTMSIADPTGQSIAAALKMHVGMIAGLVPGNRKHSMVLSCNTLNVPSYPELKLRRESYAKSGPIIRITDDEPSCSKYERPPQKYIAEPETKVNFVLPTIHKSPMSHENSCEKIKGSPRFPHRISPAASSLTTLSGRKTSADSVFSITGRTFDEQRRYSHQNVTNQEPKGKAVLESRWKSTEDARPGPSSRD